ncbi:breast carcinoma-amplified sequence [Anaeramoeba flamelloides]|uniref:Breast carcinoma-amplified sequence n=1 Tax=Anaeramoeba flamelloides TaxID=1746091 RepID=A0AAV7ZEB5_9EUKA|nr:breast carcinoma-amplified sequence [Anaeramoeba flamelloides]
MSKTSLGKKAQKITSPRNFFKTIISNHIFVSQNSDQKTQNITREPITLVKFLELNYNGNNHTILALGYKNGWQLWNIGDLENIKELSSYRGEEPLCLSIICEPNYLHEDLNNNNNNNNNDNNKNKNINKKKKKNQNEGTKLEKSQFDGKFPILGIVYKYQTKEFSKKKLYFYSLSENKLVGALNFQNEILNFKSNSKALIVGTKDFLLLLDPRSYKIKSRFQCYPNPSHTSVFALGDRFLAYPCSDGIDLSQLRKEIKSKCTKKKTNIKIVKGNEEESERVTESVEGEEKFYIESGNNFSEKWFENYRLEIDNNQKKTNQKLGTGAKIGEFSNKLFKEAIKISGDSTKKVIDVITNKNKNEEQYITDPIGSIVIRDLNSCEVVSFFKAHKHSISFLEFDNTGSMIITSSKIGTQFHIFKLFTKNPKNEKSGPFKNYQKIFTLARGLTNATTMGAFFSPDMKKIAISTNHGTIHLFTLNPYGGNFTRSFLNQTNNFETDYLSKSEIIKLNATSRIKDGKLKKKEQKKQEILINNNEIFENFHKNNNFGNSNVGGGGGGGNSSSGSSSGNENSNSNVNSMDLDFMESNEKKSKNQFKNIPVVAKFFNSNKLIVVGNNGFLSIYSAFLKEKKNEKKINSSQIPINSLKLSIDLIERFDVCRLSNWKPVKINNKSALVNSPSSSSSLFRLKTQKYVPFWDGNQLEKSLEILEHEKLVMSEMETNSYHIKKNLITNFNNQFQMYNFSNLQNENDNLNNNENENLNNNEKNVYYSSDWLVNGFSSDDINLINQK